jgi:long-subunit fatty acid transport protein
MVRENLHKKQMKLLPDRRTLTLIFIVCASFARGVCAQPPRFTITITPEPVGSGARALGQSAFIAVADDATAASWNPAGLINLESPEASFVGAWRTITKDYSVTDDRMLVDQDSWSEAQINFMSYAQSIPLENTDVVISVNYHQVYDFGVEFNSFKTTDIPSIGTRIKQVKGKSEGAVSAYSLAGGLSIPSYPEIAIGASFNWYTQSLLNDYAWQVNSTTKTTLYSPFLPSPSVLESTDTDTFDDFRGYNFTFGLLWDVYEREENLLTLGLVYHTPFTAKVDRELVGTGTTGTQFWRHGMDIDFPPSIGAGLNYRISDALSVGFDVEWKKWSVFKQKYDDGRSTSPYDSGTLAYRLGAEHLTFFERARESVLACRGGLFYEQRPVYNYTDPLKYLDPLKVYGLSAGLGWTVKEQYSLDFAYQFRWGEQNLGNIDYDYREHLFVASLIIYF